MLSTDDHVRGASEPGSAASWADVTYGHKINVVICVALINQVSLDTLVDIEHSLSFTVDDFESLRVNVVLSANRVDTALDGLHLDVRLFNGDYD